MRIRTIHDGFTLIELLVVVAVLAILAAIATFNMLEVQARSKVARVHADVRTIKTALENYAVDNGCYPHAALGDLQLPYPLTPLIQPVAYLAAIPEDPFGDASFNFAPNITMPGYNYKDAASTSKGMPADTYGHIWLSNPSFQYMIHSSGPNRIWDVMPYIPYDPTNGTISTGDICQFGPG